MPSSATAFKRPAPRAKPVSLEADVLRAVLSYLSTKGFYVWRNNNTAIFDPSRNAFRAFSGLRGVADILGILPDGRFLAIECKSSTGRTTSEQDAFLANVNTRGGVGFVARGLEDVLVNLGDYLGMA